MQPDSPAGISRSVPTLLQPCLPVPICLLGIGRGASDCCLRHYLRHSLGRNQSSGRCCNVHSSCSYTSCKLSAVASAVLLQRQLAYCLALRPSEQTLGGARASGRARGGASLSPDCARSAPTSADSHIDSRVLRAFVPMMRDASASGISTSSSFRFLAAAQGLAGWLSDSDRQGTRIR